MTLEMQSKRCDFQPSDDGQFTCTKCGIKTKIQTTKCMCRIHLKEPSLIQKVTNFIPQAVNHELTGRKACSKAEIDKRLAICRQCEIFKPLPNHTGGVCTHSTCGCTISDEMQYLNKLAWQDQECPLKKWLKIEKITESGV